MIFQKYFYIFVLVSCVRAQIFQDFLNTYLKFVSDGGARLDKELLDQPKLLPEYDFIIVGAGTAGCVLANRLSENPKWKVLLIEAGGNENLLMDIPLLTHFFQQLQINWKYTTEPQTNTCLALKNQQSNWPRGKVMGGSSVLNYMIYTRGNYRDYNRWKKMGADGWAWEDVEPYFRKLENYKVPGVKPGVHGTEGPMSISYFKYISPVGRAFVKAGQETGKQFVDYNGAQQMGFSYIQVNKFGA